MNFFYLMLFLLATSTISVGQNSGFGSPFNIGMGSSGGSGFGMFGSSSDSNNKDNDKDDGDETKCPPISHDCDPKCIKYDEPHCRKCECPSDGSSNSPFNQGKSLYQTPYSSAMNTMADTPFMATSGGGSVGSLGMRTGPLSWPSLFLHGGASMMTVECIKGDIVCPQYCLVEDENGCKSCPCGPANGMSPPITSGHVTHLQVHAPEKEKKPEAKDCIATLVCMLSCKDGYKLGPKGQDGCQSCSCMKSNDKDKGNSNNQTQNSQNQNGQSGNGSGSQTGNKQNSNSESGNGNGQTPSPSGAGMPSPFGMASGGSGFNPMFPGASMTGSGSGSEGGMGGGMGSGMGSGMGGGMGSGMGGGMGSGMGGGMGGGGGSSGCVGPFCAAAGSGASPSSSGTSTESDGCIGPACSAKNGKQFVEQAISHSEPKCPTTDLCVKTCKYSVKLGPKGSDGCHSCACQVHTEVTTPAPLHQRLCDEVVKCMLSCHNEYQISETGEDGCPSCSCQQPLTVKTTVSPTSPHQPTCDEITLACMRSCSHGYHLISQSLSLCPICKCLPPPTTAAPTRKPSVFSILKSCPEAVHCMTTCRNGYSLETVEGSNCPRCSCNMVEVVTLECAAPLSCPYGCLVGYKCSSDGCPSCDCIIPAEVGIAHTTTHTLASIQCNPHFSCVGRCPYGYKSGSNGCPTCICLSKVTAVHHVVGGVTSHGTVTHNTQNGGQHLTVSGSNLHGTDTHVTQNVVHSSTWEFQDILKHCRNVFYCVTSCRHGFEIGDAPIGHCPQCTCKAAIVPTVVVPIHTTVTGGSEHHQNGNNEVVTGEGPHGGGSHSNTGSHVISVTGSTNIAQGTGSNQLGGHAMNTASHTGIHGAHTGTHVTQAPLQVVHVVHANVTSQGGSSGGKIVSSANNGMTSHNTGSVGSNSVHIEGPSHPHVPGQHSGQEMTGGNLDQSSTGHVVTSQDCIGPACSAKNGLHINQEHHLLPSQCAEVLHCVFSCHNGYKLGAKNKDGCPTCQCLEK